MTLAQSPVHTIRLLTDLSSATQSRGAGKVTFRVYRSLYFHRQTVVESLNRSNTADKMGRT